MVYPKPGSAHFMLRDRVAPAKAVIFLLFACALLISGCGDADTEESTGATGENEVVLPGEDTGQNIENASNLVASTCQETNDAGNLTWIAGDSFDGLENWPNTVAACYEWISKCLSALSCDSTTLSNISGSSDIRSLYPRLAGSDNLREALNRLSNDELMMDLLKMIPAGTCSQESFLETQSQIMTEFSMLQLTSSYYENYELFFDECNSQMDVAFTSVLTLLALPSSTQVAQSGVPWFGIISDMVLAVAGVALVAATGGSAAPALLAGITALQVGTTATQQVVGCAENCGGDADGGSTVTLSPAMADLSAGVLDFNKMVSLFMLGLEVILGLLSQQQVSIASNWGRLQRAAALAHACPIRSNEVKQLAISGYGAMQWTALTLMMPSTYQIYWQRQYGGNKGPTCYYDNTGSGYGCTNLDMGCYEPAQTALDDSVAYTCAGMGNDDPQSGDASCFQANYSEDGLTCQAQRYVWVGEVGNPSAGPSSDFWEGLGGGTGPINTFINPYYGQSYEGAEGAWTLFTSSCAYMSKLYIPAVSGGSIQQSISAQSTEPVSCNVYGMPVQTYAFADCQTNLATNAAEVTLTGTCVNGYGSSFGATSGDSMWSTGNFNQYTYIPNTHGDWSSTSDGEVGCCMPWINITDMPAHCDYALCDCYSLAEAGNNDWLSEDLDGQLMNSGSWWGSCSVVTNATTSQMVTTSEGLACDWMTVLVSESDFAECSSRL